MFDVLFGNMEPEEEIELKYFRTVTDGERHQNLALAINALGEWTRPTIGFDAVTFLCAPRPRTLRDVGRGLAESVRGLRADRSHRHGASVSFQLPGHSVTTCDSQWTDGPPTQSVRAHPRRVEFSPTQLALLRRLFLIIGSPGPALRAAAAGAAAAAAVSSVACDEQSARRGAEGWTAAIERIDAVERRVLRRLEELLHAHPAGGRAAGARDAEAGCAASGAGDTSAARAERERGSRERREHPLLRNLRDAPPAAPASERRDPSASPPSARRGYDWAGGVLPLRSAALKALPPAATTPTADALTPARSGRASSRPHAAVAASPPPSAIGWRCGGGASRAAAAAPLLTAPPAAAASNPMSAAASPSRAAVAAVLAPRMSVLSSRGYSDPLAPLSLRGYGDTSRRTAQFPPPALVGGGSEFGP